MACWNASRAARVWRGGSGAGAAGFDVAAGAVGDLAGGGGALADRGGDVVVADVEDFAQHEDGALGRCECFEHEHERPGHAFGEFGVGGDVRGGEQGFGQPGADVGLFAALHAAQPVE